MLKGYHFDLLWMTLTYNKFSIHQGMHGCLIRKNFTQYHNTISIEKINSCIVNSQPSKLIWSLSLFLLSSQFGLITFFFVKFDQKLRHSKSFSTFYQITSLSTLQSLFNTVVCVWRRIHNFITIKTHDIRLYIKLMKNMVNAVVCFIASAVISNWIASYKAW